MTEKEAREEARTIYCRDICDCHGESAADEAIEIIAQALLSKEKETAKEVIRKTYEFIQKRRHHVSLTVAQAQKLAELVALELEAHYGIKEEE